MASQHEGAAQVVAWMMREGRHMTHMREFGDEMCRRMVTAGIPIWRAFCSTKTLHPQVYGTAYLWRRGQPGAERLTATTASSSPRYADEPDRGGGKIRRHDPAPAMRSELPARLSGSGELKSAGGADYLAMPMKYSSGEINCITFSTDRASGFSDREIAGLADVAEALAVIVEVQSTRRIARHLMDTYVGHRTGERVLSGRLPAAPRRPFTRHLVLRSARVHRAGRLASGERLIAMLNDYFEVW